MMLKVVLVLAVVVAQHYAATPPNVRPPAEQLRGQDHLLELVLPYLGAVSKIIACIWAVTEITMLVTQPAHRLPPTPALVAGAVLVVAGALLRVHCFRTLGTCFTFELAIRPAHALVTRGAYGVVRHPSYTGVAALVLGWLFCLEDYRQRGVGAWVAVVGGGEGRGAMACVWATVLGTLYVLLAKRMDQEDAMLENNFGDEWRTWAKRVPYRLLPGVL